MSRTPVLRCQTDSACWLCRGKGWPAKGHGSRWKLEKTREQTGPRSPRESAALPHLVPWFEPLRDPSGATAPRAVRRYVLFQPPRLGCVFRAATEKEHTRRHLFLGRVSANRSLVHVSRGGVWPQGSKGSGSWQVLGASRLWTVRRGQAPSAPPSDRGAPHTSPSRPPGPSDLGHLLPAPGGGHRGGPSLGPGSRAAALDKWEEHLGDKGRDGRRGGGGEAGPGLSGGHPQTCRKGMEGVWKPDPQPDHVARGPDSWFCLPPPPGTWGVPQPLGGPRAMLLCVVHSVRSR